MLCLKEAYNSNFMFPFQELDFRGSKQWLVLNEKHFKERNSKFKFI